MKRIDADIDCQWLINIVLLRVTVAVVEPPFSLMMFGAASIYRYSTSVILRIATNRYSLDL